MKREEIFKTFHNKAWAIVLYPDFCQSPIQANDLVPCANRLAYTDECVTSIHSNDYHLIHVFYM